MTKKIKPKDKPHYVNNKEFSQAVMDYAIAARAAKEAAINNYKIETATRTGNPNAFSYFTQICFFAFIRRITKEKKQQEIKFRFIEKMGIEDFAAMGMDDAGAQQTMEYVDTLRQRIDKIRVKDDKIKEFAKAEKEKEKLELFMV